VILRSDNCAEINEASNTASKPSISAPTSHKTSKQEMSVRLLHRILQTGFSVLQGFWSTQKTKFPARQSQKLKTICFLNAIKSNLRLHHIVYPEVSRKNSAGASGTNDGFEQLNLDSKSQVGVGM